MCLGCEVILSLSFTFFPCEHANNLGGITTHLAIKHHSFEVSDFEKKPPLRAAFSCMWRLVFFD
ncbi:hypothetical protein DX885_002569 [Vibrio mimicus]